MLARTLSEDQPPTTSVSTSCLLSWSPSSIPTTCSFSPPSPSASEQSPLSRWRPVITASHQNPTRKSPFTSPSTLPPSPDSDLVTFEPVSLSSPPISKKSWKSRSQDSGSFQIFSDNTSVEDIPGILKNPSESSQTVPLSLNDPKAPTKSILKSDSNVRAKTDFGYGGAEDISSSSSTEDLARSFTDVIIDPLPGHGRRSAPEVRNIHISQCLFFSSRTSSMNPSQSLCLSRACIEHAQSQAYISACTLVGEHIVILCPVI